MKAKTELLKSCIIAFLVFFIDALYLGEFLIAFFVAALVLLKQIVVVVKNIKRKDVLKLSLLKAGAYIVAALLTGLVVRMNSQIAVERAELLVQKIEQYRRDAGTWPENLSALVPEYLDNVPAAKYVFSSTGEFTYRIVKGEPMLYYYRIPPIMSFYDFEKRSWSERD